MALVTRTFVYDWGITGKVGILGIRLRANDGSELRALTTDGIEETDPGVYVATVENFDEAWSGFPVWTDGTFTETGEPFTATAAGVGAGGSLPTTRRLPFVFKLDGVLTDVTGTPTLTDPTQAFGIRRKDTGDVLLDAGEDYTRESAGSYYYEVAENGFTLEYGVEYVHPVTGATERYLLTSFPQGNHYSTQALMQARIGTSNAALWAWWADLENNQSETDRSAMMEDALRSADRRVNRKLLLARATLPYAAPSDAVSEQVQEAATLYAVGYLIKKREDQSSDSNTTTLTPGDSLIAEGDAVFAELAEAGLLVPDDDTTDDNPGGFEFVPVQRTGFCSSATDENSRPIILW